MLVCFSRTPRWHAKRIFIVLFVLVYLFFGENKHEISVRIFLEESRGEGKRTQDSEVREEKRRRWLSGSALQPSALLPSALSGPHVCTTCSPAFRQETRLWTAA